MTPEPIGKARTEGLEKKDATVQITSLHHIIHIDIQVTESATLITKQFS